MAKRKKQKPLNPVVAKKEPVKEDKKDLEKTKNSPKEEKKEKIEVISKKKEEKEIRIKKAKRKPFLIAISITLIIAVVTSIALVPLLKATKFGLDLQGGFEILYKVTNPDGTKASKSDVSSTIDIMKKRIDVLGITEPEIIPEGQNIRVQLAGVEDETEAKKVLSKMANLSFRDTSDNVVLPSSALNKNGVQVVQDEEQPGTYYLALSIRDVEAFAKVSEELYDRNEPLVIWLDFEEGVDSYKNTNNGADCTANGDSRCISSAIFRDRGIVSNTVSLSGGFSYEEAKSLADLINSGGLETKLEELSSRTVDPTFGENALGKTFVAGIIGVALISLLLITVYHFSGFIVSVGMLIYTAFVFLIFNLLGASLTLPSIAAVVIGIGMAVDASVITFSRIKEELRAKQSLQDAYKKGNKNSLTSIIDANITTLIAAIILFYFGESRIQGFATMLIISIFVTLFVMVYLMRYLLGMFVKSGFFEGKYNLFLGIRNLEKKSILEKINFSKWNPRFLATTCIVLVIGTVFFVLNGFNLGIEFRGGTSVTLKTDSTIDSKEVEKKIEELGYDVDKVEVYNDAHEAHIVIDYSFAKEDEEKLKGMLESTYKEPSTSIDAVSTEVKEDLVKNAILSLVYTCIGLIIYVSLRFTFSYGISAILALLHDVLIVVFVFSILRFEVSSMFIAAVLSIIGYSINDTIVAFDRLRENKKKLSKGKIQTREELKEVVNRTLKDVIGRSILTSVTTLIPVITLILFGSREIITFNYALLIGLIAGTYSSLFLALQVWYLIERKNAGKPEKKKWYEVEDKDDIEELKVKGINC